MTRLGLAERIRGETLDLERSVNKATRAWREAKLTSEDQDHYLDSVALNLHAFYSGIERLFELIARRIDQAVPQGESWHQELLMQMSQEWPSRRPAVIGAMSLMGLEELRRFRHVVRNVYTDRLIPEKMESLLSSLPQIWLQVRSEMLAFADFLDAAQPPDTVG